MSRQHNLLPLNWRRPGKKEVAVAGTYVAEEVSQLYSSSGGASKLDIENVQFVPEYHPYLHLEHALKEYIAATLRIPLTAVTFEGDGLCDKIGKLEKDYSNTKKGLWHQLWYGMGNARDTAEAWLGVIPDAYGLAVVKTGVAVVFKLAEDSKEKREKVFKTFSALQSTLLELRADHARFRDDPKVQDCAETTYKAVVKAVEDMVLVLEDIGTSSWTAAVAKFKAKLQHHGDKPKEDRPTLDGILDALEKKFASYQRAIGLARDRSLQRTEGLSRLNAMGTALAYQNTNYLVKRTDEEAAYRRKQRQEDQESHAKIIKAVRGTERNVQALRVGTANGLEGIVALQQQQQQQLLELNTKMTRFIILVQHEKATNLEMALKQHSKHTAVVSFPTLCWILAQPLWAYNPHKPFDLEHSIQHPGIDLRAAVTEQAAISQEMQGQAQSLLDHKQFCDWMARSHPCLIMVDADMEEATLDALSAISVLSGTLATSLMQVYQGAAVVVHFFCGLHAVPGDPFYGPIGLVRSLILQLLTKLDARDPDMRTWSLDFIDDRDFLESLEQHSLPHLCEALHRLLYEFPPDTYVYCIVDSVSCFDVSRLLRDLGAVMELFRRIVNDRKLAPIFKVLLTNPGESTREIRNMPLFREDPSRLITLSRHDVLPEEISEGVVNDHLLTAPPLMRGRTPSPFRYSRAPSPALSARQEAVPVVMGVSPDFEGYGDDEEYWLDMSDN
ncbi:hypothetical protein N657DRAFT_682882 [Parathielavia appendiculata]|uniref:Uncharacterized protein n=1 Tax=Parathielavia appendiculata TaxID=2587402 RepID=A0AAN6TVZ5_9PEZI|nr:hypothetical protein N657DRAFT_682882 [Parathielavia appendiculata]